MCCQTPPRPLVRSTSFLVMILIPYPGWFLSIFHDLRSKVKVTTEVKVVDFFNFGKFDELSRKLKIFFSKMSYKFHENFHRYLKHLVTNAGIQLTTLVYIYFWGVSFSVKDLVIVLYVIMCIHLNVLYYCNVTRVGFCVDTDRTVVSSAIYIYSCSIYVVGQDLIIVLSMMALVIYIVLYCYTVTYVEFSVYHSRFTTKPYILLECI